MQRLMIQIFARSSLKIVPSFQTQKSISKFIQIYKVNIYLQIATSFSKHVVISPKVLHNVTKLKVTNCSFLCEKVKVLTLCGKIFSFIFFLLKNFFERKYGKEENVQSLCLWAFCVFFVSEIYFSLKPLFKLFQLQFFIEHHSFTPSCHTQVFISDFRD